jgi:hypothetical protein
MKRGRLAIEKGNPGELIVFAAIYGTAPRRGLTPGANGPPPTAEKKGRQAAVKRFMLDEAPTEPTEPLTH